MALSLALTYIQSNDAATLQLTDATGLTGAGGWGQGGNITYTDIDGPLDNVGTTYGLSLDITITTSNSVTNTYDQIDLYDEFGPFTTYPDDMVFEITPDMLIDSVTGGALGLVSDPLPDGIYAITYKVIADPAGSPSDYATLSESILVDGTVRIKVYDQLRLIPTTYLCVGTSPSSCPEYIRIRNALVKFGLLRGMVATVSNARQNEILDILDTLERLTLND
jgi:hypothetical protein